MVVAAEWGTGQVFWSMLWFFLFFIWIWLPYLGVFVYLIARGHTMNQHAVDAAQQQDEAFRQYVQQAATTSPAEELTKLADLKAKGLIDDTEYARLKTNALA